MPKNPMLRLLIMGVVAGWLIFDITNAKEAPSQGLMILQYALLAAMLIGIAATLYSVMTGGRRA